MDSSALRAGPVVASSGTADLWSSDLPVRPVNWRQIAPLALMPASTADDAVAVCSTVASSGHAGARLHPAELSQDPRLWVVANARELRPDRAAVLR